MQNNNSDGLETRSIRKHSLIDYLRLSNLFQKLRIENQSPVLQTHSDRIKAMAKFIWPSRSNQRRRRDTWGGSELVDEDRAMIKLREFCDRNERANKTTLFELQRRESVVKLLSNMDITGEQDYIEKQQIQPSSSSSSLPFMISSFDEGGKWSESAAAIEAFANRPGSVEKVEQLIQPYDVFEPDMRSTRWNDYKKLLSQTRTDFDKFLHTPSIRRSSRRAATFASRQVDYNAL